MHTDYVYIKGLKKLVRHTLMYILLHLNLSPYLSGFSKKLVPSRGLFLSKEIERTKIFY